MFTDKQRKAQNELLKRVKHRKSPFTDTQVQRQRDVMIKAEIREMMGCNMYHFPEERLRQFKKYDEVKKDKKVTEAVKSDAFFVEYLAENPGLSPTQVGVAYGKEGHSARNWGFKAVNRLVADGRIIRTGFGKYQVTPTS